MYNPQILPHGTKSFRPQQGLTIMNRKMGLSMELAKNSQFPSPTGVNYYEYLIDLLQ